jgi:hypothetical protein
MQTWTRNIPGIELVILNQENMGEWIGDFYDKERFAKVRLAMQSDLIQTALLEEHGGVFIDADTIITADIFEWIDQLPPEKLTGFSGSMNAVGQPMTFSLFIAPEPHSVLLSRCKTIQRDRLLQLDIEKSPELPWDYFCNDILDDMLKEEGMQQHANAIDWAESGYLLESVYCGEDPHGKARYQKFYFENVYENLDEVLSNVKLGLIFLHNSWTSAAYKKLNTKQVMEQTCTLSRMLDHVLKGEYIDTSPPSPKKRGFLRSAISKLRRK